MDGSEWKTPLKWIDLGVPLFSETALCWLCKAIMVSLTKSFGIRFEGLWTGFPFRVRNSSFGFRGGTPPTPKQHSTKTEAVCSEGV